MPAMFVGYSVFWEMESGAKSGIGMMRPNRLILLFYFIFFMITKLVFDKKKKESFNNKLLLYIMDMW